MTAHPVTAGSIGSDLFTLIASTVDTVTFTGVDLPIVEVVNPGTNIADVWFTTDGTTPTVGGANCYFLPAGSVDARQPANTEGTVGTVISLISSGTPTIRVQRGS